MTTTILLVDDHPVFIKGLKSLLDDEFDMTVIGEAGDGTQALDMVRDLKPEVVVMDITMSGLNGIEATRQIVSKYSDIKVIALSIHSEKEFVEDMLKAGAIGYILKESVPEELVKGIRCVINGSSYLSPAITGLVLSQFRSSLALTQSSVSKKIEIVEAKLEPEKLPEYYVERYRLNENLNRLRQLPLIMITAPAGYGKTTLVSAWAGRMKMKNTWLSLDRHDNDLRRFLLYLIHCIRKIYPDALSGLYQMLQTNEIPPIQMLAAKFINGVELIGEEFWVVVDNFRHVNIKPIDDFFSEVFRHPVQYLHWVLISRSDPFLPLAKLRAKGLLGEIRMQDLKFTHEEAKLFLKSLSDKALSNGAVEQMLVKTEGWITGLLLMALSLSEKKNPDALPRMMGRDQEYVMDYLFSEVFCTQPDWVQKGLLLTSVLSCFNLSLCNELFQLDDPPGGQGSMGNDGINANEFMERVQNNQLFILRIDKGSGWFRYHSLFQNMLQKSIVQQESQSKIQDIHKIAYRWFKKNGHTREAIYHAILADEFSKAKDLISTHRHHILNTGQWHILKEWVDHLPPRVHQGQIELILTKSWVFLMTHRINEIERMMALVKACADNECRQPDIQAEILFFKGLVQYFKNNGRQSMEEFKKAADIIPDKEEVQALKSEITFWTSLARHLTGKNEIAKLENAFNQEDKDNKPPVSQKAFALGILYLVDGNGWSALRHSRRLSGTRTLKTRPYADTWCHYLIGNACFQTLQFQKAHTNFSFVVENQSYANYRVTANAFAGLMLTCHFMDKPQKADEMVIAAETYGRWTNDPFVIEIIESCKARLALLRNDTGSAAAWAGAVCESTPGPGTFLSMEIPAVTECRVLIHTRTKKGLEEADERLDVLYDRFKSMNMISHQIEVMVLRALTKRLLKKDGDACDLLGQAMDLACEGGWFHPFFELGDIMVKMLEQTVQKDGATDLTKQFFKIFKEAGIYMVSVEPQTPGKKTIRHIKPQPLIDPMSNREMEILELLSRYLQNKEIAEQLYISPETVKSHLKRIYDKLMVSNRRDAISKARELGLV